MSFLDSFFKFISYYNDEEDPLHKTDFIMEWDSLTEEQRNNYLKSMLAGAGIAVILAGGYILLDEFVGAKLDMAVSTAYNYIMNHQDYVKNKELEEDIKNMHKDNFRDYLIKTDLVYYDKTNEEQDWPSDRMFKVEGRYFVRNVDEFKSAYKDHQIDLDKVFYS